MSRPRWVALFAVTMAAGCAPSSLTIDWTCDFDASESRPLSVPDASPGPEGVLPPSVCQNTCGPPATHCTLTHFDGGEPAAVCPVCTF